MQNELLKDVITLHTTASALTATTAGSGILVHPFRSGMLYLRPETVSGTSPSLLYKIETSPDNTNWFHCAILIDKDTTGTLTRTTSPTTTNEYKVTSSAYTHMCQVDNMARYIRTNAVIDGTSPSFAIEAKLVLYG